jgi:carboxypeptidase family protein
MQINAWKKWRFILRLIVACLLAGGSTLVAQLQEARIIGVVYDPQHAVVPGATVTVTNTGTNISETVKTDSSGNYVVTPLDPGAYTVT